MRVGGDWCSTMKGNVSQQIKDVIVCGKENKMSGIFEGFATEQRTLEILIVGYWTSFM